MLATLMAQNKARNVLLSPDTFIVMRERTIQKHGNGRIPKGTEATGHSSRMIIVIANVSRSTVGS
jgi:hypothetical protein